MANDKLTDQLKSTDKKVDNISKERLGSAYKGFLRIPDWDTNIHVEEMIVSDEITTSLVAIAPSGNPLDSITMSMLSDLQTGTGAYSMVDFTALTGISTYGMSKWARLVISADKLLKPYKIIYTHGGDIPAGQEKAVMLRIDASGNFVRIPATVTKTASDTLEIDFKAQYIGVHFIGLLSSTWTMTTITDTAITALKAFPVYNYSATDTVRTYIAGVVPSVPYTETELDRPKFAYNNTGVGYVMTDKEIRDTTKNFCSAGSSILNSNITSNFGFTHANSPTTAMMAHAGTYGVDVMVKRGIERPDGSLFFPQFADEETYVLATTGSTVNINVYGLRTNNTRYTFGTPNNNYRLLDGGAASGFAGVVIEGTASMTEKKKVRVIAFTPNIVNDTERRGFKCFEYLHPGDIAIDSNTNGSYKGDIFSALIPGSGDIGSEYTFFVHSPDGVNPTVTITNSGISVTPTITDIEPGWRLYTIAEGVANGPALKFQFNKDVFFGYYPFSPNHYTYAYSFITHVPTTDDKDYGTSYKFPYTPMNWGVSMSQPTHIAFKPLTEEETNVTVTVGGGAPVVYKNIASGSYTECIPDGLMSPVFVTITSNQPIHVFMHNLDFRAQQIGSYITWRPGGIGFMPNLYSPTSVQTSTLNYLNRQQIDISQSTSQDRVWERAFKVTSRLRDNGIITWDPTNFKTVRPPYWDTGTYIYNTDPIKAEIKYSTDNSTWGAPLALTNGAKLPTPNVANAQYIDIKFYTKQYASASANRSDDCWVGGFSIV